MGHLIPKFLIPDWIIDLSDKVYVPFISPYLAETRESFDSLGMHMLDIIGLARDWIAGGQETPMDAGLLRNLVEANMSNEEGRRHLSDDELLADTFVRPFLPPWKKHKMLKGNWIPRLSSWQAMVFMLRGIDSNVILTANSGTSAHTLCFAILLLALHPDIQERVYEEARRLWPEGLPLADSSVCDFPFC